MTASQLDRSQALFIRRWGEMGAYWGISRTMAEIHALLYLSTEPICTDELMERLAISRGNASMNLRLLVDWGLINKVHIRGQRREYYSALTDVWEMFDTIVRQRRRREVEPIIETIHRCRDMVADSPGPTNKNTKDEMADYDQRLNDMLKFLEAVSSMVDLMLKVGPKGLGQVSKMMKAITV